MTLRDEIVQIIFKDWVDHVDLNDTADSILALINEERCEWTNDCDGMTHTECGAIRCYDYIIEHVISYDPYCPCCGKRISLKEE